MTWTVEVLVRTPETALDNDALLELTDAAEEEHDWTVSRWELGDGFRITTDSEADTIPEATTSTHDEVAAWLQTLDMRTAVASVRAVELEVYELEVDQPTLPELVSAAEAAEILDVSRQRVHELAKGRPDFPAPLYELRTGPLWKRDAIEAFERRWERRRGRPPLKAVKGKGKSPNNVTPLRAAQRGVAGLAAKAGRVTPGRIAAARYQKRG